MTFIKEVAPSKGLVANIIQSRFVTFTLLLCWVMMSLFYFNIFNVPYRINKIETVIINNNTVHRTNEEFLIDTPGCSIPNHARTMKFRKTIPQSKTCGTRAVYVKKVSDNIIEFTINKINMEIYSKKGLYECSYRFAIRSTVIGKEDTDLFYTPSKKFRNGTRIKLEQEVVTVSCYAIKIKNGAIYEDSYIVVKKAKSSKKRDEQKWNVLLVGMDTMSRGRVYSSMPATVRHLQRHAWLDYRGYQKLASNTFPNVMPILTGKKMSSIYHACSKGMSSCNDLMMWSRYQRAGYVTAYAEDNLRLPDTFHLPPYKGFKTPPTDHYMRPLFLTKEINKKGLICTKSLSSGKHMLDYAVDFANTYKNSNFFGLFWMNSYSHNPENTPTLVDQTMVEFFERLNSSGVLKNTFVFFLSDHGIRFGNTRYPVESYYEERLPMLFMWVPESFRRTYPFHFESAAANQHRLTTPYDLHMTLVDILRLSNASKEIENSEACPECTSFFIEKSRFRTCTEAKVDEKWCSCRNLQRVSDKDVDAIRSLNLAVSYIQNVSQSVQTIHCMKCYNFTLKTVLRIHSYVNEDYVDRVYYVVALVMDPGRVAYEANIVKEGNKFEIISPTETISTYNVRGNCVKHRLDRAFCVCEYVVPCK